MSKIPRALTRQREELAWELAAVGTMERVIADKLDEAGLGRVTRQAVSAMLIRTEARVLAELTERVEGMKARQTAALMRICEEAMAAWERSKVNAKSLTTQADGSEGAKGGGKMTTQIRERDGDPRFLEQARAALEDVRKIWGLAAPVRVKHGGDEDSPPIKTEAVIDWSKVPLEYRKQLLDLRNTIVGAPAGGAGGPGAGNGTADGQIGPGRVGKK